MCAAAARRCPCPSDSCPLSTPSCSQLAINDISDFPHLEKWPSKKIAQLPVRRGGYMGTQQVVQGAQQVEVIDLTLSDEEDDHGA